MNEVIYNNNNLKEEEINKIVKRAKMLIGNSNDEILIAFCHNNYYLVGGHVEDNETFDECLIREIKEETGIDIPIEKREPFFVITYMNKDYPSIGINTKSIANYYYIKCDIKPDLTKINLTDDEKDGNLELRYIHKDKILEELKQSLKNCTREGVVKDTINVVEEYIKKFKN